MRQEVSERLIVHIGIRKSAGTPGAFAVRGLHLFSEKAFMDAFNLS